MFPVPSQPGVGHLQNCCFVSHLDYHQACNFYSRKQIYAACASAKKSSILKVFLNNVHAPNPIVEHKFYTNGHNTEKLVNQVKERLCTQKIYMASFITMHNAKRY